MTEENPSFKQVKINRIFPAELITYFVNHSIAQHENDYFILTFFEAWPPIIMAVTDEERKAQIDALDHVDAKCISRLVLTPPQMRKFVKSVKSILEHYEESKEYEQEDYDDEME